MNRELPLGFLGIAILAIGVSWLLFATFVYAENSQISSISDSTKIDDKIEVSKIYKINLEDSAGVTSDSHAELER